MLSKDHLSFSCLHKKVNLIDLTHKSANIHSAYLLRIYVHCEREREILFIVMVGGALNLKIAASIYRYINMAVEQWIANGLSHI